ncbi:hypothetical protein AGMMS49950_04810 [Endomicrobiia bacterium]|nr:hypothetical protein AGMMS49950_04810 [Endomicrobiia bacterium]
MFREDVKKCYNPKVPCKNRGVAGTLTVGDLTVGTLENGGFKEKSKKIIPILIKDGDYHVEVCKPSGKYPLGYLWLHNVKGRTGIYIHSGTRPDHSDGCILVTEDDLIKLIAKVKELKQNTPKIYISVRSGDKVKDDFSNVDVSEQEHLADGYAKAHPDRVSSADKVSYNATTGESKTTDGGSSSSIGHGNTSSDGSPESTQGGQYSLGHKDSDNKKDVTKNQNQEDKVKLTIKETVPSFDDIKDHLEWDPEENRYVYDPDKHNESEDDDKSSRTSDDPLTNTTSNKNACVDEIFCPNVMIEPSPANSDDKTSGNTD